MKSFVYLLDKIKPEILHIIFLTPDTKENSSFVETKIVGNIKHVKCTIRYIFKNPHVSTIVAIVTLLCHFCENVVLQSLKKCLHVRPFQNVYNVFCCVCLFVCFLGTGACEMPLGLSSNIITDSQLSASSSMDEKHQAFFARLFNNSYWIPSQNDSSPWLQVTFRKRYIVSAIVIDGQWTNRDGWVWLRHFYIMYSYDELTWNPYRYDTLDEKVWM